MIRPLFAACAATIVMAATASAAPFSLTTLYAFNGRDGGGSINDDEVPVGKYLYGTTNGGGIGGNGTIYRLNTETGVEKPLYKFTGGADGCLPSGMTLVDKVLYGTAVSCGAQAYGVVFSIDLATLTERTLYSFQNGADGSYPQGKLLSFGGYLWGTADYGGANGAGTIFKFDPVAASVTPVYSFGAGSDAAYPPNDLIAEGGVLYGVTQYGGTNNTGTVYAYDTAKGTEAVLYSFGPFGGTDGYRPASQLFYRAGYVYGTAQAGGANNLGIIYRVNVKTGREDVLHNFSGKKDGASPYTGLTAGAAGLVYGETAGGGQRDRGTIFSFNLATNTLKNLYSFGGGGDGALPYAQLSTAKGIFYGNTATGGDHRKGTVFSFKP
jgi:uncharacterized repeat protein (TIGR03803 family)